MRNQRGIADLVIIGIAAIIGLTTWFVTPKVMDAFHGGSMNREVSQKRQYVMEPQYAVNEKTGNIVKLGMRKVEIISSDIDVEQPQLNFWQKLQSLGAWFIALLALAIFLIPGFGVMLWNRAKALKAEMAANAILKRETVKIVAAVQAAKALIPTDEKEKMGVVMSTMMNDTTKELVTDIKTNGTITKPLA